MTGGKRDSRKARLRELAHEQDWHITRLLDWIAEGCDGAPAVLDWSTGDRWADRLPGYAVFAPVGSEAAAVLPYLDETIDLVLLPANRRERIDEARRVARWAVAVIDHDEPDPERGISVEWRRKPPAHGLSVSIVIPCFGPPDLLIQCLDAIEESTSARIPFEVIVVDDGPDGEISELVELLAPSMPFLRLLTNPENLGFQGSCNRGADMALGDILVFLNKDAEPLPGWLSPLLALFANDPSIGAAGSLLLNSDGSLQESGGVLFRDGTAANFGRGLPIADPLVRTVREVHYCSGAALATRRDLFARLGGFDVRFHPAYYEDTDYCMSVREAGLRVVRQPESVVVHHEGADNGRDVTQGRKRYQEINRSVFVDKWRHRLASFPARPVRFDRAAWQALDAAGLVPGAGS
jgi:GT2 family glycosyltransferase